MINTNDLQVPQFNRVTAVIRPLVALWLSLGWVHKWYTEW